MIVLDELFRNLVAMTPGNIKNADDRVLIYVKDARAGANAVAFCQRFQHSIDGFIRSVKACEDTVTTRTKSTLAFQTAVAWSVVRSIALHQFEIGPNRFTAVRT